MANKKLKPLYLSLSKWRCGQDGKRGVYALGSGATLLKNESGYMCCLGQFENQLDKNVLIRGWAHPQSTKTKHPLLVNKNRSNTYFSRTAMLVNDDKFSTIEEKVISLEVLAQYEGYTIVVVE